MECRKIQETLDAYLEGMLSSREEESVRGHLTLCPGCRAALEDLKKTTQFLKSLEPVEPPFWLTQRIMTRVREEAAEKGGILGKLFYPLRVKIPVQAFAAILLVGLAVLLYTANQPEYESATLPVQRERTVIEKTREQPGSLAEKSSPPRSEPAAVRESRQKDETTIPAASGDQRRPVSEESEKKSAGSAVSQDRAAPEQSPPPPSPKEKEQMPVAEGRQHNAPMKTEAFRAAAPAAGMAAKPGAIEISIRAADVEAVSLDIETALKNAGAGTIAKESHGGSRLIIADVSGDELGALLEKLRSLGASVRAIPEPAPRWAVTVRIEINTQ
jgi:hypothetical protein